AERGAAMPTSARAGGALRYRLEPEPGGLGVRRTVVAADGTEQPLPAALASIVSGRVPGPPVAAPEADLLLHTLIGERPGPRAAPPPPGPPAPSAAPSPRAPASPPPASATCR